MKWYSVFIRIRIYCFEGHTPHHNLDRFFSVNLFFATVGLLLCIILSQASSAFVMLPFDFVLSFVFLVFFTEQQFVYTEINFM